MPRGVASIWSLPLPKNTFTGATMGRMPDPTPALRLHELRARIDELDEALIRLLDTRNRVVASIQHLKAALGLPARNWEREQAILSRARRLAQEYHLDPDTISQILTTVLRDSVDTAANVANHRMPPT